MSLRSLVAPLALVLAACPPPAQRDLQLNLDLTPQDAGGVPVTCEDLGADLFMLALVGSTGGAELGTASGDCNGDFGVALIIAPGDETDGDIDLVFLGGDGVPVEGTEQRVRLVADEPQRLVTVTGEDCATAGDEDDDGRADCDDLECSRACTGGEDCDDQYGDNDGDGLDNCADPDCDDEPYCQSGEVCWNDTDDDGDGDADCADAEDCSSYCATLRTPWVVNEDGLLSTCAAVGGDTVVIHAVGNEGSVHDTTAPCDDGQNDFVVHPDTYLVDFTLEDASGTALATTQMQYTLQPASAVTQPAVAFDVTTNDCADVVIARLYFNGGASAAAFDRDFVELHNRTVSEISLAGWGLHLDAREGAGWQVVDLSSITLPAFGFALIRLGHDDFMPPVDGVDLPAADATGLATHDLDGTSTIVALRETLTPGTTDVCPADAVDLWGTAGTGCFEGQGFYGGHADAQAVQRPDACTDTENNSADFQIGAVTTVRNTSTLGQICSACQ